MKLPKKWSLVELQHQMILDSPQMLMVSFIAFHWQAIGSGVIISSFKCQIQGILGQLAVLIMFFIHLTRRTLTFLVRCMVYKTREQHLYHILRRLIFPQASLMIFSTLIWSYLLLLNQTHLLFFMRHFKQSITKKVSNLQSITALGTIIWHSCR